MNAQEFLTELWGEAPPGQVNIWTAGTGVPNNSHWYRSFDAVDQDLAGQARNIYCGMAAMPFRYKPPKERSRYLKEDRMTGIPGLWVDMDWSDPAHKNAVNLPPAPEDAMAILQAMPAPPTLIVHSGHGYQAHWLFDGGPWLFESPQEQKLAAAMEEWWTRITQDLCKQRGWVCDSVFDLTRLMRVPGFTNWKRPEAPKPVTVVTASGLRLDRRPHMEDVRVYMARAEDRDSRRTGRRTAKTEKQENPGEATEVDTPEFRMNPRAEPPARLWIDLENSARLRDTWERRRRFKSGKNTASEYDLSLATQCLQTGWTEQETVDLMIAWRRKHSAPAKLRYDYYRRTLDMAQDFVEQEQANELWKPDAIALRGHELPEEEQAKQALKQMLGAATLRILRYDGDPVRYRLETEHGAVNIGRVENLTGQTRFRNTMAEGTGRLIPHTPDRRAWEHRAQAMLRMAEPARTGPFLTARPEIQRMLQSYLKDREPVPEDRMSEALATGQPFWRESALHLIAADLRNWLLEHYAIDQSQRQAGALLTEAGFTGERLSATQGNSHTTTRAVWHGEAP